LSIYINNFQQEVAYIISQNTISPEIETEIAREFKECKSDMVKYLYFIFISLVIHIIVCFCNI